MVTQTELKIHRLVRLNTSQFKWFNIHIPRKVNQL